MTAEAAIRLRTELAHQPSLPDGVVVGSAGHGERGALLLHRRAHGLQVGAHRRQLLSRARRGLVGGALHRRRVVAQLLHLRVVHLW